MIKRALLTLFSIWVCFIPTTSRALFGVGDIVFDPAVYLKAIEQIEETVRMINQLKGIGKSLDQLTDWEAIDHINLAGGWNGAWVKRYTNILDRLIEKIDQYQGGGAFSEQNLGRIMGDEIYPGYHEGWEEMEDLSQPWRNVKKQMLWTKIQMKHAVNVGAQLRKEISKVSDSTTQIMDRNMQAVGQLQAVKIGTQMTMNVVKSLELTNVHLNEFVQAYTAHALEENSDKGRAANGKQKAMMGIGEVRYNRAPAPVSPIEK